MWSLSEAASFHGLMTLSSRSIRHLHTRDTLFGGVVAHVVTLRFSKDAQESWVGIRHPMTECEAADEDSNSGKQAVEEVEYANGPDADEVEERPLHTEVCEGLVQAFVDPVPPTGCNVCLHRRPSQLEKSLGCRCWVRPEAPLTHPKAKSERWWRARQSPCRLRHRPGSSWHPVRRVRIGSRQPRLRSNWLPWQRYP